MIDYYGTYHPKVFWILAPTSHRLWLGSNNLTRDGLLNNIEFGAQLEAKTVPVKLNRWAAEIAASSRPLSDELINSYETERLPHSKARAGLGTFTWSRREKKSRKRASGRGRGRRGRVARHRVRSGDLIIEVMPKETGPGGKQIQFPVKAVGAFFGLPAKVGSSRTISVTPGWIQDPRELTMTVFGNHTIRLTLRELDYQDRPCVLVFHRVGAGAFAFDIIQRSTFPVLYRDLLLKCSRPTRKGSRRWGFAS